jgi:eukaryotic-like serine/threonine-protein kinase
LADAVQRWMANRHHKQQQYDNMRMEGRELRANLQSFIRDLTTNVRFMANLPPIQGLVDARTERAVDEENVWRDRLSIIYKGLLQANFDFSAIAYCCVQNSESSEIVRVERHSVDRANVRAVPRSRLASSAANEFVHNIMLQKPEEVFVALTSAADSPSTKSTANETTANTRWLAAGVPIFDEQTEEPFGYVVIECDLRRIIEAESRDRIQTAQQIIVVDSESTVWLHNSKRCGPITESVDKPAAEIVAVMDRLDTTLAQHAEFIDETNREVYAARLDLVAVKSDLVIVLDRRPSSGEGK